MSAKQRYVIVGTGGRCVMFIDAIVDTYRDHAELVGFCDLSQTRMDWHNRRIADQFDAQPVPTFSAEQFDDMVRRQRPHVVIVTSMDSTHHDYIIRALDLGCDVISEKPMTIDAEKAHAIFDAIERTGRSVRVSFNYRYSPHVTKVKSLIMDGAIGTPLAVDFSWMLDTSHGAEYFHRWHSEKDKSGGLLVHKSTHHFDLINWWLRARPQRVFAMGALKFYGKANAQARGEHYSYERYYGHPEAADDPFRVDLESTDDLRGLYLDAEADNGYIRDRNVFRQNIDIEDTMAVIVRYDNQVIMNYSLIAYSPWEGFRVAITGTKGRIELFDQHSTQIITGQSDKQLAQEQARNEKQTLTVFPMFGRPYDVSIEKAEGGHGGGDPILLEQLFAPDPPADPYERAASHLDGAASILVGISANRSMSTGQPIDCDTLLALPSYEQSLSLFAAAPR